MRGLGLAALLGAAAASPLLVDRSKKSRTFDGIGGLSGGGATSVLLPAYREPQRSQILDYLFKPNFGASLQILKVEIGGDSQSTDGTESSHMHSADKVDLHTGYEWWLMQEAKRRNPDIKLYGLAWAFPGWVGNHSNSPFKFPELTARYLVEWVKGAKSEYGLDIDYLGIWNERASDSTFVQTLRKALNAAGIRGTKIVVKDGGSDICQALAKDKAYADAVDIIGLHYPSDFIDYSTCHSLGKPVWASEESSSYDDLNGAACWGRIMNAHWVLNQMTSSIMWNLVGAYYHGTNWYASSMLTSVQPWSGYYEINPVIWATAHVTQFTKVGWRYLTAGAGSGTLPLGGYYATLVDPDTEDFTINVVKISRDHASCTRPKLPDLNVSAETVTFKFASSMKVPESLHLWYSNFEDFDVLHQVLFEHRTIQVENGQVTLDIPIGSMFTITTIASGTKGAPDTPMPPDFPYFPLPVDIDAKVLDGLNLSQDVPGFADQIGAFEVHASSDGKRSLKQMVPELPIGWSDHGSNGPMTLLGQREHQDLKVSASFKLPESAETQAACVAVRVDQMWNNGVILCVDSDGKWTVDNKGPPLRGLSSHTEKSVPVASGKAQTPVGKGTWHRLSLMVQPPESSIGAVGASGLDVAEAFLDGEQLASVYVRNLDTGFAAFGCDGWFPIEFRDLTVNRSERGWDLPTSCRPSRIGDEVVARPCQRNGLTSQDEVWVLLPSYQIAHLESRLCLGASEDGRVLMQACNSTDKRQLFVNDYTRIRNMVTPLTSASMNKPLSGNISGAVRLGKVPNGWNAWSYFPNTGQLRNQYTADLGLGYPMCLSTCGPPEDSTILRKLMYI